MPTFAESGERGIQLLKVGFDDDSEIPSESARPRNQATFGIARSFNQRYLPIVTSHTVKGSAGPFNMSKAKPIAKRDLRHRKKSGTSRASSN